MTRVQFLALLSASGVGFVAGTAIDFKLRSTKKAIFVHTLRIEAIPIDGGVDRITAYRTQATVLGDGGFDFDDLGPADCVGDAGLVHTWIRNGCRKPDGGIVQGIYVIEARPAGVDDGGQGDVAIEAYGDESVRCVLKKSAAFRNFLRSLNCTTLHPRLKSTPL